MARSCWFQYTPAGTILPAELRPRVVLFSNDPFRRAETKGSYSMMFNATMNFDNSNAGRKVADR